MERVTKEAITMKLQTQTLNLESYFSVFDEQKIVVIEVGFFSSSFRIFFFIEYSFFSLSFHST